MFKKSSAKRTKVSAQSPVNALSNRNHYVNEAVNNSLLSQYYSSPMEYTLDLRTNFKPPAKLAAKKTPECQISLGSAKESIATRGSQKENNSLSLVLQKQLTKADSRSPMSVKSPNSRSGSIVENSAIQKGEFQEDEEINQKILKLQDELNKLGICEPRSPTTAASQGQNIKYSTFIEIVGQLREVISKLQIKDVLQRKEISTLRKANESLKNDLGKAEKKLKESEKMREITTPSPVKYENYLKKEKRNLRIGKQRLEDKVHTFAKSALSSPTHKTFELYDRKKKFPGIELPTEKSVKDEKTSSVNHSYSAHNEALLAKNQHASLSSSQLPHGSSCSHLFYSSMPIQEIKGKDIGSKENTEIDTLVQLRTVTMSDIENSDEGTSSSHQTISHHNINSLQDIYNTRDTRVFPLGDQFQSLTQRENFNNQKRIQERTPPNRLNLSYQNSPNNSSMISFPNNSFVPSKAGRDELRDKSNEKDGVRSHSQPAQDRHTSVSFKESQAANRNLSPAASEIMSRYKKYLNEPHVSPLQCESKSINKDFGWHYLTTASKNGDDTKNLSVNGANNLTRNDIKQPISTDELSKIIIPEEFASEELQKESTYDEKVTLFNRCLKLTMGLGSSILDESQQNKSTNKRDLISTENIVLSPNVLSIKRPFCPGISMRK